MIRLVVLLFIFSFVVAIFDNVTLHYAVKRTKERERKALATYPYQLTVLADKYVSINIEI
jgi:hypothetical protein